MEDLVIKCRNISNVKCLVNEGGKMDNIPNKIYEYYFKDLTLLRLAFGGFWDLLLKTIIVVISACFFIFYFISFSPAKVLLLVMLGICLIAFIEYSRYKVVIKHSEVKVKYSYKNTVRDYENIREILLLKYLDQCNLISSEGIMYLINSFSRKSEKFKVPKFALWLIVISAIIQSIVDFLLNANIDDWQRINLYFSYIKVNLKIIVLTSFIIIVFYYFIRVSILNVIYYLLNLKSSNYHVLCNVLEDKLFPLVLNFSHQSGNLCENIIVNNNKTYYKDREVLEPGQEIAIGSVIKTSKHFLRLLINVLKEMLSFTWKLLEFIWQFIKNNVYMKIVLKLEKIIERKKNNKNPNQKDTKL